MQLQVALADPNGPRAPLRCKFEDPDGHQPTESPVDQLSFPTSVVGQTGEIHRMDPIACGPIIKCRKTGCPGSCALAVVEYGCTAGKEAATRRICGTTFPRYNVTLSTVVTNPLLPFLNVPAGFLGATCRVNSSSIRRIPMTFRAPPCVPSESKLRLVSWFMWCQAPSRRSRSSIRDARPRSCVFCRWNGSSFSCVRTPCCFFCFWWTKDFGGTPPSHLVGLEEKICVPLNTCPSCSSRYKRHLHTSSLLSMMVSLESSWCRVPRTSAERDGTGSRHGDNPRRTREPNGK